MENSTKPSDKEFRFFLLFWAGQVQSLMGSNIIRFVIIWWIVLEYDYAFLLALQQAGMLTGALIMSFWKGFERKVVGVGFGILLMYLGFLIAISIPSESPYVFLLMGLGLALTGFGLPVANVSSQTIWQKVTPPEKIGRVFAARRSIAQFTSPTAMIISGILAEILGLEAILFACAALGLTSLAYTWLATDLSVVERPAEQIESPVVPPAR